MPNKEWKRSERNMAEALGGRRVPITGRARGDVPDISHDDFAIEHKYGHRILSSRLKTALIQADAAAETLHKAGGKHIPIVTFEEKSSPGYANIKGVLMTLETFKNLVGQGKD